jgi:hypothetical protein
VVTEGKSCQKNTTRAQRRAVEKLATIHNIYDKFVAACEANCTPGTGRTVDESLQGFRERCSFKQYVPNKPSKYGINVYVLADRKTFYTVSSKVHTGADTHAPGLPVPTQAILKALDLIQEMETPIGKEIVIYTESKVTFNSLKTQYIRLHNRKNKEQDQTTNRVKLGNTL